VTSNGLLEFAANETRLFILGADRSGKSALARTLYRLLQAEKHLVPILLSGSELKQGSALTAVIDEAYRRQYSATSLPMFKRLAKDRTCLIIDDLDKARLSRKAHATVIAELEGIFGKILLFAHDLFDLDQALEGKHRPVYYDYRQYLIEELNRVQRGALIEKWVTLGRPDWEQEDQLHREVLAKEKIINALLGRQLVPAYPIVVMAMLQTMESMRSPNTVSGSYGELYEALITDRLARVSKKATDLGIKYALISQIAYRMYEREANSVSDEEVAVICDEYFAEYQIRRSPQALISDLVETGIFRQADGNFRFFYPYYYHFFVARYFRDKISDNLRGRDIRDRLVYMADRVYYEQYANILVFYLYLTKDTEVIEQILGNAERIYSSYSPCLLEADIESLNRMSSEPPSPVALICEDIRKNREEFRKTLDEIEEQATGATEGREKLVYGEDVGELVKLNIALKTIHIFGQVLRSFPGDIKKELKIRIAEQCYLLGLRVLGMALGCIDANADFLRTQFILLLQERRVDDSAGMLGTAATKAVLDLSILWAFAIVKTLSRAVGMEELSETYKEVLRRHEDKLSIQIIDSSIRLDHFGAFPEDQMERLHKRTHRSNLIAYCVLRNLLVTYYQLYPASHQNRAKFAPMFDITLNFTRLVEGGLAKD
jgi:hypothetical protein